MKTIMGGAEEVPGSCTVTVTCPPSLPGTVSCSSDKGKCKKGILYVQCDSDDEIWC